MRLLLAFAIFALSGGAYAQDATPQGDVGKIMLDLTQGEQHDVQPVPTVPVPAPKKPTRPLAGPAPVQAGPMLLVGNPGNFKVPETELIGPTGPVGYGKVITLKVKKIAEPPPDLYSVTYIWRLYPTPDDLNSFNVPEPMAFFGSGIEPATVRVTLIASYLFVGRDKDGQPLIANEVVAVDRDVVIGGGTPPKPPAPGPDPGPVPPAPTPLPDTPFGLTKLAYQWIPSVTQADPLVRKSEAAALARSFRNIAQTVTSGVEFNAPNGTHYKLDEPGKFLTATLLNNNAAIPNSKQQWTPWFIQLDGKLKELKAAGKLNTMDDYVAAWNEIGVGLEAASK